MSTWERAIAIAAEAHLGQFDKAGSPYILHSLRVMLAVKSPEARIVEVLHDVVEDGGITPDYLRRQGFDEVILAALASVTKTPADADDYEGFARRAGANAIGRVVKLADLKDNSDLSRIADPSARDHERLEKYRRAIEVLEVM